MITTIKDPAMKAFMIMLAAATMAAGIVVAAGSDVIITKSKSTLVGTVTNLTEKNISIITKKGTITYPWAALSEATVKRYNPVLYEELLDQKRQAFEEIKRKQGLVQYKNKWMTPKQKIVAEKKDQGLDLFEGTWQPTNDIAAIKLRREMEAAGKKEYKGAWYTDKELEDVKEVENNKGLKGGMTAQEVIAKWGQPTTKKVSPEFASRNREMWFYQHEKSGKEDRLVFETGTLREVLVDQELSDF
jgi:hypothetical protein